MKLRLKPFEKLTRRRARQQLRKSPADWREFKRYRWWRRERSLPPGLLRMIMLIGLIPLVMGNGVIPKRLVAATLFWSVASAAWLAGQLVVALRISRRLLIWAHLPLSDSQIFDLQWRSFLQKSLWSVVDFTTLYSLLAVEAGYGWKSPVAGFAMAVPQWLVVASLSTWLVAFGFRKRLFSIAAIAASLAFAVVFIYSFRPVAEKAAAFAGWLPPTNWILYVMGFSRPLPAPLDWWPAVSLASISLALPFAIRRLRLAYTLPEDLVAGERERGPVEAQRREVADGASPDPCAEIKAAIKTRGFLGGFNWSRAGLVERMVAGTLSSRDRLIAEFLTAGSPRWTAPIIKLLLITAVVVGVISLNSGLLKGLAGFGWIMAMFVLQKQFGGMWPGIRLRAIGGSNLAVYSVYPVGFWQIARISMRVHALQLLLLLAAGAVPGVWALYALHMEVRPALLVAGRVVIIVLAMMAFPPIFMVSSGTNDGTKVRIMLLLVTLVTIVGGSSLWVLFADIPGWMFVAAAFLLTASFGALWLYGHAYNSHWFDLQAKPKEPKTQQA